MFNWAIAHSSFHLNSTRYGESGQQHENLNKIEQNSYCELYFN